MARSGLFTLLRAFVLGTPTFRGPVERPAAPGVVSPRDILNARMANHRLIQVFAQSFEFEVITSGEYASGASFNDVLEYLADQGKDFTKNSVSLRTQVAGKLTDEFRNISRVVTVAELKGAAENIVRDRIVARLENKIRDYRIARNSPAYTEWKAAHGFDTRVGIKTGQLLDAVRDADIEISYRSAA